MSEALSIAFGIASMFGFGLADFIAKTVMVRESAYRTILISQCVGAVPFFLVTLICDWDVPDGSLLFLTALSGAIATIVLYSFYQALKLGNASVVTPMISCMTVVTVVLSVKFLGETLDMPEILLVSTVFLGILLVAVQSSNSRSKAFNVSILLALLAMFMGGGNAILLKWIAETGDYLMGFLLTRFFMIGFLALLFPISGKEKSMVSSRASFAKIVLLGMVFVLASFARFIGFREGLVSIVAPIANSSPAVTIILAYSVIGERLLLHQKIGVIAILIGISALSVVS